jgi:transposase
MNEQWKPISGYEGFYEVSNFGNVRSLDRYITQRSKSGSLYKRLMKSVNLIPGLSGAGYLMVVLCKPGEKNKPSEIHRIVAKVFVSGYVKGLQVCHKDGNKFNNKSDNLRWDTCKANHADKVLHGTDGKGSRNPTSKLSETDVRQIRASTESSTELAKIYGVSIGTVSVIRSGKTWQHEASDPLAYKALTKQRFTGTNNPNAKLNSGDIDKIKELVHKGASSSSLAATFNVHVSTINRLKRSLLTTTTV